MVLAAVVLSLLLRMSCGFWRCREEQLFCESSETHKPLSSIPAEQSVHKNWRYFLTLTSVAGVITMYKVLLQKCGNLNGLSPCVLVARYGPPIVGVCTCAHWALQNLPANLQANLLPWQQNILPQAVYAISVISLTILIIYPLFIYILPRQEEIGPFYNKDAIIPAVYSHLKLNWRRHFTRGGKKHSDRMPIVYGLASVYSAAVLVLVIIVGEVIMLLLGDGLAPPAAMMLATLPLMSFIIGISRTEGEHSAEELVRVPWSAVIIWGFLASHYFYVTGHHPTFPTIHWNAAFTGFSGNFITNAIPAFFIGLNTFASQVLFALGLPLLLFAPFVTQVLFPRPGLQGELLQEARQGEFALFELDSKFKEELFCLYIKYIVFHGVRLFATMMAATLLRRHLMVWKIFAPRFIFEAVMMIVTLISVMLGYLLIVRTHSALTKWVKVLEEKQRLGQTVEEKQKTEQ